MRVKLWLSFYCYNLKALQHLWGPLSDGMNSNKI